MGLVEEKKTIIFDLDGLLVDTEKIFYKAFKGVAKRAKLGLPSFNEYIDKGIAQGLSISDLVGLKHFKADIFERDVYEQYEIFLRSQLRIKKGAKEALDRLRECGYRLVLVTGSKKEFADYILSRFDIASKFECIYTRDDAFPPKPNPKAFNFILERYELKPWECLVIEDTNRGINAALSAGLPAIIIPNEYTLKQEYGPRVTILKSLNDINKLAVDKALEEASPKGPYTLANLYGDNLARLGEIFKIYRDIYGLPSFNHPDKDVDPKAFEYAKRRSFFIILAMIAKNKTIYFQRSFDSGHLSLILPGTGIYLDQEEGILDTINRIAARTLKRASLADIAPVAYLTNEFVSTAGDKTKHYGLGIRAILLNDIEELEDILKDISVKGFFVKAPDESVVPQPPSRFTYSRVKEWLNNLDYETYINEIETQKEILGRYRIHQRIINPIFRQLSRIVGKYSIYKLKMVALDMIRGANSYIDIACGDDRSIFSALERIPLVVANDISLDQIKLMQGIYFQKKPVLPKANTLLFTNHDCCDLPFRENAFDAAQCRNLLHHMKAAKDLLALLNNLRRVARKIVIIEIMDPAKEKGLWAKLRNAYYKRFLKDEGEKFYNKEDFETVVNRHYAEDRKAFRYFQTIRGIYMCAEIIKKV